MKRSMITMKIAISLATLFSLILPVHAQTPTAEVDGQKYIFKNGTTYKVLPNGNQQPVRPFGTPYQGVKGTKPKTPTAMYQGRKYIFQNGKTLEVKPNGAKTPVDFFRPAQSNSSSSAVSN